MNTKMYEKIALDAFHLKEDCDTQEGGGVTPILDKAFVSRVDILTNSIKVFISYCYQGLCGLSDRMYRVDTSMKECMYEFKDGKLTRNGGEIFNEPWCSTVWTHQGTFFKKYADVIPVSYEEFMTKKQAHHKERIMVCFAR